VVKRSISSLRRAWVTAVLAVATLAMVPVALAWRARAELLELAAAGCLAFAAAAHVERGAWLVAAAAAGAKATEIARREARR
jgi:homospermidine synthase